MIATGITKDFGVMASDSASYVADAGKIAFETPKLSIIGNKYILSFLGTPLYFSRLDVSKFTLPMNALSLYVQEYLRSMKKDVENILDQTVQDTDEKEPNFCLYVLGMHGKRPMLAQFNSFLDFAPRYLWSDNGLKFSSVLYGDDSNKEKQAMFKESHDYMVKSAGKIPEVTPGLVGEILTRGIYHKADLEEKIGTKKKYAGGIVNAAGIMKDGKIFSLSGVEVVNGRS